MKRIKKMLSFLLIILTVNSLNLYSYAITNEISVEEFKSQLCDMFYENINFEISSTIAPENLPTNRVIVKTNSNSELEDDYGAILKVEGYNNLHVFQYSTTPEAQIAFEKFEKADAVYVEYDYYISLSTSSLTTNSETNQQYLSWNTEAVRADEALEYLAEHNIELSETVVAVLDSGLYSEHSYFDRNRILDSNYKLTFSDEISFSSMEDELKHGTHVSGIVYDNTPSNVKISPYIVFPGSSLTSYILISTAIDAAVSENFDGDLNNIHVINLSLSSVNKKPNKTIEESLEKAISNNIIVVVAAGNACDDANDYPPGNYTPAITVAATDKNDKPDKSYSNYGTCVDVSAPGTGINSTVPRYYTKEEDKDKYEPIPQSLFMEDKGTSMAAPLVSAAAAILKSINPDITPAQAERLIKETAYVPEGWDYNYGSGIVDFYSLVKAVIEPEGSETPEIKLNSNDKFEIKQFALSNSTYYTIDGTDPTPENGLVYNSPLDLSNKTVSFIKAASYRNGEQIGETAVYKMYRYETIKMNYKETEHPISSTYSKNIKWKSADTNIATVDSEGNIKAVGVGETQITAKLSSGKRIIYNVKVEYSRLQWFIMVFLCGSLWYI